MMKRTTVSPPQFAERLLGWFCKGKLLEEILGDLYEFHEELLDQPNWKRKTIYWFHVFHFLRPSLVKRLSGTQKLNYYGMLKLYLRTSFRQLFKHRLVSAVSLFTLIVGAISFHLIYAWIDNELNMDQFHSKQNRIHLAISKFNKMSDFISVAPGVFFRLDYTQLPEVEKVMVIHAYNEDQIKLKKGAISYPGRAWVVDSVFFDFFDFKLRSGDKEALKNPGNIVVTQEFANKLFPDQNPLGKMVEVNCDQVGLYQIGAVIEDIPANSSINIDFLVPRHSKDFWRRLPTELLLVDQNFDRDAFNTKFETMGRVRERHDKSVMSTLPFSTLYFDRPLEVPLFSKKGDLTNLRAMQLIAVIILIVTVLSLANLQTTIQLTMADRIGIKKVMGASRLSLGFELMVNGLLYFCSSLVVAFLVYELMFPYYLHLLGLDLDQDPMFDLQVLSLVLSFFIAVSFSISFFKIMRVGVTESLVVNTSLFRVPITQRILTTLQYALAIVLLISTSVIFLQLRYMLNKDTGLIQSNIIETNIFELFPSLRQDSVKRMEMLNLHARVVNQLKENMDIIAVSQGTIPINNAYTQSIKRADSDNDFELMHVMSVDTDYDDVFGLEVIDGIFFSDSLESDDNAVVINESAMRHLNIERIDDTELLMHMPGGDIRYSIIGVVKDFHFQHLSHKVKPLILRNFYYADKSFIVRHKAEARKRVLDFMDRLHRDINPDAAFTFYDFEDKVNAQYANEKRMSNVVNGFTLVAILLASSGLFTFAYHETKRRTKEIGIRKVIGANRIQILFVMGKSLLFNILVALLLASPIAWYLMDVWLADFANRVEISWWVFVGVSIVTCLLAVTTVSWQTLKAAGMNPVESLRYE
ncbi:MAG: ABC transporter permease [Bacteroidota bacterium]